MKKNILMIAALFAACAPKAYAGITTTKSTKAARQAYEQSAAELDRLNQIIIAEKKESQIEREKVQKIDAALAQLKSRISHNTAADHANATNPNTNQEEA